MPLSVIGEQQPKPDPLDELLQSGYRYALSLTHYRADAEDLLQDASTAIARAGGKWDKAYLFASIRNRFIDRYRRNRKILFIPLEGVSEQSWDDGWDLPDVIQGEALQKALARLRVDERETLFLAVVEGFSAQEIATMTNRPRGTVLSVLHRTKSKLRRFLQGGGESTHE